MGGVYLCIAHSTSRRGISLFLLRNFSPNLVKPVSHLKAKDKYSIRVLYLELKCETCRAVLLNYKCAYVRERSREQNLGNQTLRCLLSVSNVHCICIQKCYVKAQKVQHRVYQSFLNWSWIIQIKHKRVVLTLQGFSSDCHKRELQLRQQSEWTHNLIEKGVLDKHPRLVAKLWTWINHCQPETFSCFCCCCCFRHLFILFLFFSLLFAAVVLKICIRRSTVYFPHNCLFTPVFGHKKAKWFDCIAIMWKKSSNMLSLTFTSYNFELTF